MDGSAVIAAAMVEAGWRHLPVLAMLAVAGLRRRSLGAAPCYAAAVVAAMLSASRLPGGSLSTMLALADLMAIPTMLCALARAQVIPGLRRGWLSEAERAVPTRRSVQRPVVTRAGVSPCSSPHASRAPVVIAPGSKPRRTAPPSHDAAATRSRVVVLSANP